MIAKQRSNRQRRVFCAGTVIVLVLTILSCSQSTLAQATWNTNGNDISNANSGNVGVGTTTPVSVFHVATESTVVPRGITNAQHSSDGNSPLLIFRKSRGTKTSPTAVLDLDGLGNLQTHAYDGSSYITTSRIKFGVDGTVSGGSVPTSIQFFTGNNNSGTERLRISSSGNVGIGTTAPAFKAHVVSGTDNYTNLLFLDTAVHGGTLFGVGGDTNNQSVFGLSVYRAGQYFTRLFVDNFGRLSLSPNGDAHVGVGTAAPNFRLDVQGGQINSSGGLCIAGDCKTAWSQVGGGSSQWTTSGSNIHFNTGNVGIGTTSPWQKLTVVGTPGNREGLTVAGEGNSWIYTDLNLTPISGGIAAGKPTNFAWSVRKDAFYGGDSSGPSLVMEVSRQGGGVFVPFMINPSGNVVLSGATNAANGNVGIGTNSPAVRLALNGSGVNVYNTDAWIENNIHVQGNETLTQGGRGRLRVGTAWGYMGLYSETSSTGVQNDLVLGAGTGNVRVGPGAAIAQNFLVPNGNVGIGTASPSSARLHLYSPSNTYLRIGAPLASQSAIAFNDDTNGQDIVLYRPENTRNFSIWTAQSSTVMTVTQPGSVGLGTTTPGFKFDVQGGQINSSGGLCIAGDCKTAWSEVGGTSQWTTAGSTIHYNTGSVGVGTASPVYDANPGKFFTVDGGSGIGSIGAAGGTGNTGTAVSQVAFVNSSLGTAEKRLATIVGATDTAVNSGTIDFYTASGGAFSAPRMRITSAGNIGIGNTAPAAKLHVSGSTRVDGTNGRVYLGAGATNGARGFEIIEENATTFSLRHHDPNVAWQNIVINPHGGNVGIGTLSPTTKLHVAGDGKVTGNLTVDGSIAAKYQDVAEWVPAVQALAAGTVVTLNRSQSNLVEPSSKAYDTRVAGVVSEKPGLALGEPGESKLLIATTGRVRIKVDATHAPIEIGDLLVTSEKEGIAMKSVPVNVGGVEIHRPGTLIGKALEPLAKGQGEILVLLSLQ